MTGLLLWSASLLTGGAILGLLLVTLSQVAPSTFRLAWPGAVHGLVGLAGFGLLLAGLRGPPRGVQQGAGSFGLVAAVFVGLALLGGAFLAGARLRRQPPAVLVIGVHATLGVAGLVMLAAYLSV